MLAAGRCLGPFGILVHVNQLIKKFLKTFSDIRHTGVSWPLVRSPRYSGSSTALAQWLRCCATNRKVAGSIPAGVSGFFIDIKSFRSHYGPGIGSASDRNEDQEYFLEVKAAGA